MIKSIFKSLQLKLIFLLLSTAILFSCSIIKLETNQKQQLPDKIQTAEKLLAHGVSNYNKYNYKQAGIFFNNALYAYRSIDNPRGIILSLSNLSKIALALGNVQLAEQYLVKAKNILAASGKSFNNKISNNLIMVESSIQIEKQQYNIAKNILQPLLDPKLSPASEYRIAALQNRVRIAIAEHDPYAAEWLQQFSQATSKSHQTSYTARLMRFKAALSQDSQENNSYYNKALNIYRSSAHQVGIAATLEEWSQQQFQLQQYRSAIDKLVRALFIRIDLKDRRHSILILEKLYKLYPLTANKEKEKQTIMWLKKISSNDFSRWNELAEAYNTYPQ
ncbi:MAG: hypothetical protein IME94_05670 [Proteobacteria bacterium]|nr:hypothetical protein [Pseudomonadota bacterium]